MRENGFGWKLLRKVVRLANHLLNLVIGLILVVALLYSGFGLWDTWNIYADAGLDSDLMKYHPVVSEEDNPTLTELQAINPDVCAWLTVDGTNIDYPVVRGETDQEYINKNIYGEFALSGSIFLESCNSLDFSDSYSLVYGHHMAGNVMFGEIPEFLEANYFQSHATGTLFLPDQTYEIQWFACVETDAFDRYLYCPLRDASDTMMEELIDYIGETAKQYRDIGVTTSDRLIALSTCSSTSTNGRIVLIGRINP
jgi:sortase B